MYDLFMNVGFNDFLKARGLFKIPYWIILLVGGVYVIFFLFQDEPITTGIIGYAVVVGISYWAWKRKALKDKAK
jgi:hypothetical protein